MVPFQLPGTLLWGMAVKGCAAERAKHYQVLSAAGLQIHCPLLICFRYLWPDRFAPVAWRFRRPSSSLSLLDTCGDLAAKRVLGEHGQNQHLVTIPEIRSHESNGKRHPMVPSGRPSFGPSTPNPLEKPTYGRSFSTCHLPDSNGEYSPFESEASGAGGRDCIVQIEIQLELWPDSGPVVLFLSFKTGRGHSRSTSHR